jgi:hypothetical protein
MNDQVIDCCNLYQLSLHLKTCDSTTAINSHLVQVYNNKLSANGFMLASFTPIQISSGIIAMMETEFTQLIIGSNCRYLLTALNLQPVSSVFK